MVGIIISSSCFIILLIAVIVAKSISYDKNERDLISAMTSIGAFMGLSLISLIMSTDEYLSGDRPKAIDVYRGNTELKITKTVVNDSITECDTTVVFKDNL